MNRLVLIGNGFDLAHGLNKLTFFDRIADFFAKNRRFFLTESQIFCTFAADFNK